MNGNSYRLFANPRSLFARRIRLAVKRLHLSVEEIFVDVFQEPAELNAPNPIGAVPTLITPDLGAPGFSFASRTQRRIFRKHLSDCKSLASFQKRGSLVPARGLQNLSWSES